MVRQKILQILKNNQGTTIKELTPKVNLERHTLAKHLDSLQSEGLINHRTVGRTKLWFATKAPLIGLLEQNNQVSNNLKDFVKSLGEEVTVLDKDRLVLWSTRKTVGKKCNHKRCKTCPGTKTLKTGKKHSIKRGKFEIQSSPIKDTQGKIIAFMEIKQRL